MLCPPNTAQRYASNIPRPSAIWYSTILLTLITYSLVIWIDKSCQFVVLRGVQLPSGEPVELFRGTQRGQLTTPNDRCQPWGWYKRNNAFDETDQDEIDSKMIATRVCAALSVVLGSFILLFLFVVPFCYNGSENSTSRTCCSCFRNINSKTVSCFRWTCVLFSIVLAVFSAVIPPLMSKSNLCGDSALLDTVDSNGILWERWDDKSTSAYRATFFNVVAWLMIAVLLVALKLPKGSTADKAATAMRDEEQAIGREEEKQDDSSANKTSDVQVYVQTGQQ